MGKTAELTFAFKRVFFRNPRSVIADHAVLSGKGHPIGLRTLQKASVRVMYIVSETFRRIDVVLVNIDQRQVLGEASDRASG